MNAGIHSSGMYFGISGTTGIDDGIIVVTVRIGVGTLVNAAGIAKGIMAMSGEHHCLRVLVQRGVQHLHAPTGSVLQFCPCAVTCPAGRYVCKHKDGLAGTLLCRLCHVLFQPCYG